MYYKTKMGKESEFLENSFIHLTVEVLYLSEDKVACPKLKLNIISGHGKKNEVIHLNVFSA